MKNLINDQLKVTLESIEGFAKAYPHIHHTIQHQGNCGLA